MNKTQKNQRFLVSQRPKSFRKLIYIFVILVVGLFVVSACEEIVGRRITNNADGNGEGFQRAVADQGARNAAEGVGIKYNSEGNVVYEKINDKQIRLGEMYTALRVSRNAFLIISKDYENGYIKMGGSTDGELVGCDCIVTEGDGTCSSSCTSTYEDGEMVSCSGACSGNRCDGNSCAQYSVDVDTSSFTMLN